jgi:hypothetical protein
MAPDGVLVLDISNQRCPRAPTPCQRHFRPSASVAASNALVTVAVMMVRSASSRRIFRFIDDVASQISAALSSDACERC